jgi:hypothetical protein
MSQRILVPTLSQRILIRVRNSKYDSSMPGISSSPPLTESSSSSLSLLECS